MARRKRRVHLPQIPERIGRWRRGSGKPLPVVCPAAQAVAGATDANSGVVCRVIQRERQADSGVGMNPTQLATVREGGGTFMTLKSDPSAIETLCCGAGVPVSDGLSRGSNPETYTYCPVWQAEKERVWAARDRLAGGGVATEEPESYSHGVPPVELDEGPEAWDAARKQMDELAPPARRQTRAA